MHTQVARLSYAERMRWFHEARFGMFIHWGLYSLLGRGEWVMYQERIPIAEYAKLANHFTAKKFNADAWAGLAAEAGMKYMVFTARHHDGFCLYDSQVSDFTSVKTAARRDFVAEYVDACRRAGLKVGIYYSLMDWRFPGYFNYRTDLSSAEAMKAQCHAQVRELMSNYGQIDILWYDGLWLDHDVSNEGTGFYEPVKLNAMVRELQPEIIINNRAGTQEDIDTPEQHVTASEHGRGWESCMTIGDPCGWGFLKCSPAMKTVPQLLQYLVSAAAGEGNYLLNIGPKPDGSVRREEQARLRAIGAWMQVHGEAVYGSQRCALSAANLGVWTRKGNSGYLHIARWPGKEAIIPLVRTEIERAWLFTTGMEIGVKRASNGRVILTGLPASPPDPNISVIKVQFAGEPECLQEPDHADWLFGLA